MFNKQLIAISLLKLVLLYSTIIYLVHRKGDVVGQRMKQIVRRRMHLGESTRVTVTLINTN